MMKRFIGCLAVMLLGILISFPAMAKELTVDSSDPAAYQTLTEAVSAAEAGDTLLLSGTFGEAETFPILIDKPLLITAKAGETPILDGARFKPVFRVTAPHVTLDGLRFNVRRWGVLALADRLTVKNCSFYLTDTPLNRVSSTAMWLAGAYDCTIQNNDFNGCGLCVAGPPISEKSAGMPVLTALFEVGADKAFFTSHTIEDNRVNGKPLYCYISQKDIVVPADAGMVYAADCENILMDGLDLSDTSMGAELAYCTNVTLKNTRADRCGVFGIYICYTEQGLLEKVSCTETNHGIDLREVFRLRVTDCVADRCEQGIFFSFAHNTMMDCCTIKDCGTGFFTACGDNNQASDCVITGNENGMFIEKEKNFMISGNTLLNNTVTAIRYLRSSGQIVLNTIKDNWVGMIMAESGPCTIYQNEMQNCASTCIYLRDVSTMRIYKNEFLGTSKSYLEVDKEVTDAALWQNSFGSDAELLNNHSGQTLDIR